MFIFIILISEISLIEIQVVFHYCFNPKMGLMIGILVYSPLIKRYLEVFKKTISISRKEYVYEVIKIIILSPVIGLIGGYLVLLPTMAYELPFLK